MRELWAHDVVDFEGRWHRVTKAGINPRPTRPIPIWFGGHAAASGRMRREQWVRGAVRGPSRGARILDDARDAKQCDQ
jgi:alkanesulfonate monooxygenase SsuD/methylene tetrahydromethanopterin reductase-like flavin-dependent oxidoreductase (luciferase family)